MKIKSVILALSILPFLFSCNDDDNIPSPGQAGINDTFNSSTQIWTGDFTDYPKDREPSYLLKFSHENLPAPLDQSSKGLFITGNNHSDDLFMFIKKKVSGLVPNQSYRMKIDVELASNAYAEAGVGGSPATGVTLKAGMTAVEPVKILDETKNFYQLNIDKGNQSVGGADAVVLGNVDNGIGKNEYAIIKRSGEFIGKADDKGEAWVMIGTDSGFEAITALYYTKVTASFAAVTQ
jgi:hypothetical protein